MPQLLPPSPRRLRGFLDAGRQPDSPLLSWCGAALAIMLWMWASRQSLATLFEGQISDSVTGHFSTLTATVTTTAYQSMIALLQRALSMLAAAASGAILLHLAVVRVVWRPRRNIAWVPAHPTGVGVRTMGMLGAGIVGATLFAVIIVWLWLAAPSIASMGSASALPALWTNVCTALAWTVVIAAIALAAVGYGWRWWRFRVALQMTRQEHQRDIQDASMPAPMRWHRARLMRSDSITVASHPVASSAQGILLYSSGFAVVLDWDPSANLSTPMLRATYVGSAAHRTLRQWQQAGGQVAWAGPLAKQLTQVAQGALPKRYWSAVAAILVAVAAAAGGDEVKAG